MPFLLVVAALGALAALTLLVLSFVPGHLAFQARRTSASVGLALTDDVRPIVERALAVRLRATALGAFVGLAAGVAVMIGGRFGEFGQWPMIAGWFVGIGIGGAVGAFLARPRPPVTGTRIARSRDVGLRDYVMPLELTGARIVVIVAGLIGASALILLSGNPRESTALVSVALTTLLALGSLVAFELVGRAIVAQASPAEDPTRLAWEDALRAETLRNLVTAPLTFGCVAVALGVVGLFGALPLTPLTIVLGAVAPTLLLVTALVIVVVSLASKPQQHYLRILWPQTAAAAR